MGQLAIRHNRAQTPAASHPNPPRNPNRRDPRLQQPPPPLVMGQVKILRRGEAPTAFEERETKPSAAAASTDPNLKKNKITKKMKKKKVVGFRDDVELYSATCRIGPEPEMVPTALFGVPILDSPPPSSLPLPLSLIKRSLL